MKKIYLLAAMLMMITANSSLFAQVGVGTATPFGALDITSANDGLLIPRIALVNTTTATVITPTVSELVYNSSTINDVTPGYYYWSGTNWIRLQAGAKNEWSLTGNTGTTPGTNFLGTSDNVALRFKTNAADRFEITNNGFMRSFADGTAALPAYSWNSSNAMGLYRVSNNTMALSTNSAERMRITPTGQVSINDAAPNASALLTVSATDRGIVIPNIALTAVNVAAPVTAPATSLLVYNTNSTAGANGVSPGYYYWNGVWVKMATGTVTQDWGLTGNAGTVAGTNFLGTTDNVSMVLKTNAVERARILNNGLVVVNSITPFATDRFSAYANTGESAINGYSITTGIAVYGQNTGTGTGVYGINNGNGIAVVGNNLSDGAGVLGITTGATSAGVFGRADVDNGSGVYGTSNGFGGTGTVGFTNGTLGTAIYGVSTGFLADGVYGESADAGGYGVSGRNDAGGDAVHAVATGLTSRAVYALSNIGTGVFGTTGSATAMAVDARNSATAGTAIIAAGNNIIAPTYLTAGGGGAFNGTRFGAIGLATTVGNGVGVAGAGNGLITSTFPAGSGGAFTGQTWGTSSVAARATGNRAAYIGNFISNAGIPASTVYVGANIAGVDYKILGPGAASVSTTMKTRDGERILFAPEAPENWFFDIGEVVLVNGVAKVNIDPLFVDCIADSKPFKVFVQGGEDTMGSIKVTRNQSDKSFILQDLGGASNGTVQYSIYAIWKTKENLRFPKYEATSEDIAHEQQSATVKPIIENAKRPAQKREFLQRTAAQVNAPTKINTRE